MRGIIIGSFGFFFIRFLLGGNQQEKHYREMMEREKFMKNYNKYYNPNMPPLPYQNEQRK